MKKSIANKLTARVAILLAIVLAILFIGSYHTVSRIVRNETEKFTKPIASIYADIIVYESTGMNFPIDVDFSESIVFYGNYICSWYRIDYAYMYKPDVANGTIRILGFSSKEGVLDNADYITGNLLQHAFSDDEIALINGDSVYVISESDTFEHAMETVTCVTDSFGNKVVVVTGVSLDDVEQRIQMEFLKIALILMALFLLIIFAMYLIIRKNVLRPAKRISESMTTFIHDGKRSDVRLDDSGNDEFAMISSAFNSMTCDIDAYLENIRTLSMDQERQKTELEIASNIQKGFLPPEHMGSKSFEIQSMMIPAKDIGGDLYDYLPLDDNRTLITIADVSGKGIAASMYMAVTLMLIRQFAKMGQSPSEILKSTNNAISEKNPRMLFATAFVGVYDSKTNILTYANAGHNLPYILGNVPKILGKTKNTLLGLFQGEEYAEETVKLNIGETIFLYTDGVSESTDENNVFYGTERLEKALSDAINSNAENVVRFISDSVRDFSKNSEQHDDITMLSLTVKEQKELILGVDVSEFKKIRDTILSTAIPRSLQLNLCVIAEECFTNICLYAFKNGIPDGEKIRFSLELSSKIVMQFADGGMPYDPRENIVSVDDYDIDSQIGGLGKLIAFNMADGVDYEYVDEKNILTITKYIKENQNDD